jgi:hypothetical protein
VGAAIDGDAVENGVGCGHAERGYAVRRIAWELTL